jgi:hypothetical protein
MPKVSLFGKCIFIISFYVEIQTKLNIIVTWKI